MSIKRNSIFNDIFRLSYPWKTTITSLFNNCTCIGFDVDYESEVITCPVCGLNAIIATRKAVTVDIPYLFYGINTKMTTYLPIVSQHNKSCKIDSDPNILANTLLLDILIRQVGDKDEHKPLQYLLNTVANT